MPRAANLHPIQRQRRLPRVSRPTICANKFNRRNWLGGCKRKDLPDSNNRIQKRAAWHSISQTPKQPKPWWRGIRSATSSYSLRLCFDCVGAMMFGEVWSGIDWSAWWTEPNRSLCSVVSRDGSTLYRRQILQQFFQNAGLLLWRHSGLGGGCMWASFGLTL